MIAWTLIALGALLSGVFAVALFRTTRPFLRGGEGGNAAPEEPPSVRPTTPTATLPLPMVPKPHVGATEGFGAELRALRDMPAAPELVSNVEQAATDHDALDEIAVAKQACHDHVWAAIEHFLRDHPDVALKVRASVDKTAELDVAALREALDDENRLYTWMAGDYATVEAL